MARPGERNFTYTEGDDELYLITLQRAADSSAINLTGAVISAEIRDNYASEGGVVVATATCAVVNGPGGVFSMEIAAADTKTMGGSSYKYDVQVALGGKKRTYLRGEIQGVKEVTDL
jgi:hypothetical protein